MSTTTFNIHPKLSKCNICSKECYIVDINVTKHDSLNGCDVIKCNKCHSVWYICAVHNNRFSMSNKSKMVKHFTTLHSQPALKATTSLYTKENSSDINKFDQEIDTQSEIFFTSLDASDHTPIPSPPLSPNVYEEKTSNKHSQPKDQTNLLQDQFKNEKVNYYVDEMDNHGNGICGITANAFSQSFHCYSKSSLHEASFHLQATHFCSNLTEKQQKQYKR